jgi:hypothetical protein
MFNIILNKKFTPLHCWLYSHNFEPKQITKCR